MMVKIPAGGIVLNDDRIKSKWRVEIKPFLIAKYTVTQELYYNITQKSPSSFRGDKNQLKTFLGMMQLISVIHFL